MEVKRRTYSPLATIKLLCFMIVLLLLNATGSAQPVKNYTVKEGKMFITLGKDLPETELQEFIRQFDLKNLALDRFLNNGFDDSIKRAGWKIEMRNASVIVISKLLASLEEINNPADRIIYMTNQASFDALFPSVSNSTRFGYNRFRDRPSITFKDSLVHFVLRGQGDAKQVTLAGSFNEWSPTALQMQRSDSGWVASLKLTPGKYWYKFVVDGNWITDPANRLNENDGLGNTNSVFYYTNTLFRLPGYANSKKVILSGSFNDWNESEVVMDRVNDGWELPVYLANGTHTYRFIADKQWVDDPVNPRRFPNEFDHFNSVIELGTAHVFYLDGSTNAKQVFLTGSFNGWKREELLMKKTEKGWELPYVIGPGNYQYRFIIDGKSVTDPSNPPATNDKHANSILVLQPNYTFKLPGYSSAKKVLLAGDFNNWDQNAYLMKKVNGEWIFQVYLSPGKHLYKFIVDGQWILDPGNKLWEENEHHTGNSVIWVEGSGGER